MIVRDAVDALSKLVGRKAQVDGDESIRFTITGVVVRADGFNQLELSWLHNGEAKVGLFDTGRVGIVP